MPRPKKQPPLHPPVEPLIQATFEGAPETPETRERASGLVALLLRIARQRRAEQEADERAKKDHPDAT